MLRLNWNRERWRTRDRLLEYNTDIMPPSPRAAGLNIIYPWENVNLNVFDAELLTLAREHGFDDNATTLWNVLLNNNVHVGTLDTFPEDGDTNTLYYDSDTGIIYQCIIEDNTCVYVPIKALPIEDE